MKRIIIALLIILLVNALFIGAVKEWEWLTNEKADTGIVALMVFASMGIGGSIAVYYLTETEK